MLYKKKGFSGGNFDFDGADRRVVLEVNGGKRFAIPPYIG